MDKNEAAGFILKSNIEENGRAVYFFSLAEIKEIYGIMTASVANNLSAYNAISLFCPELRFLFVHNGLPILSIEVFLDDGSSFVLTFKKFLPLAFTTENSLYVAIFNESEMEIKILKFESYLRSPSLSFFDDGRMFIVNNLIFSFKQEEGGNKRAVAKSCNGMKEEIFSTGSPLKALFYAIKGLHYIEDGKGGYRFKYPKSFEEQDVS